MLLPRLPSDPPEKWNTFKAALDDRDKTHRLCLILVVSSIPLTLVLVTVIILAVTGHSWP